MRGKALPVVCWELEVGGATVAGEAPVEVCGFYESNFVIYSKVQGHNLQNPELCPRIKYQRRTVGFLAPAIT